MQFNRTPVDIALANGRTDIAQLLQLHVSASGVIEDPDAITMETPETLVTETVSTSEKNGLIEAHIIFPSFFFFLEMRRL